MRFTRVISRDEETGVTMSKSFIVRWPDVWAMVGLCAAAVAVVTAFFYLA